MVWAADERPADYRIFCTGELLAEEI